MAYEYAVQFYTGFTPKSVPHYTKDWLLLSKASSIENAYKKAEKESKKHRDRIFRAVKINPYGNYIANTDNAHMFQYFYGGWRLSDFEVDANLTNIKQSYNKKYEKFVLKYSSSKPNFVVHYVTITHSKPEDFDNFVSYKTPSEVEDAIYSGNFREDVNESIRELYGGNFVVYSLLPTNDYKKGFLSKSGDVIKETSLSDIYRYYDRTLKSVVERTNKIYLPESSNDNTYEMNTIIRKMNHLFENRTFVSDFRATIHDMSSYFYRLAEANKANPNVDYTILEEFANDFMSCLPDMYDGLSKEQEKAQAAMDLIEEKIRNVR